MVLFSFSSNRRIQAQESCDPWVSARHTAVGNRVYTMCTGIDRLQYNQTSVFFGLVFCLSSKVLALHGQLTEYAEKVYFLSEMALCIFHKQNGNY